METWKYQCINVEGWIGLVMRYVEFVKFEVFSGGELFAKGFRWRMGNGNDILIKDDPWIPNEGNFKPSWMIDYVKDKRVSFLIDHDGS
ncbi:unnamed protein product [Citrullus colocynthis]|uniref:Uncharacterized protein n=1 Tax=Citrullus colocynthis TaxID=252529 RepID=A0ABP0Z7A8_9ROSI